MRWADTIASKCRYGEVAETVFGMAEIIWEHSEDDYQGTANILALFPDGRFAHYEWTYGSCSGCDTWEAAGLTDDEIAAEMCEYAAWFPDEMAFVAYLERVTAGGSDDLVPTAQPSTAGSIPGMVRWLYGGIGREFLEMRTAFYAWKKEALCAEAELQY